LREKRKFSIELGYSSRQERQVRKFIFFLCGLCVFAGDNPSFGCGSSAILVHRLAAHGRHRDMRHRRIGFRAMLVALACFDMHDVSHGYFALFLLSRYHAAS
jgi:hypothetical protein